MTQADTDETIDQAEDFEQPAVEAEQVEAPEAEQPEGEAESDEVVVTLGEPEPEEPVERAPEWVRDLRKRQQETAKENRELRQQLESLKAPAEKPAEVVAKPTLASCEYDEQDYEAKLAKWYETQRTRDEAERKKQAEGAAAQAEWQGKVDAYAKERASLKISGADEAEGIAFEFLNENQRATVLKATKKPALVMIAIGKNPKIAKELGAIKDYVELAAAVAVLEATKLNVTPKKTAPIPESTVRGNARVSAGIDSTLDRLRKKADETGDRTEVARYMREQAAKKRA